MTCFQLAISKYILGTAAYKCKGDNTNHCSDGDFEDLSLYRTCDRFDEMGDKGWGLDSSWLNSTTL